MINWCFGRYLTLLKTLFVWNDGFFGDWYVHYSCVTFEHLWRHLWQFQSNDTIAYDLPVSFQFQWSGGELCQNTTKSQHFVRFDFFLLFALHDDGGTHFHYYFFACERRHTPGKEGDEDDVLNFSEFLVVFAIFHIFCLSVFCIRKSVGYVFLDVSRSRFPPGKVLLTHSHAHRHQCMTHSTMLMQFFLWLFPFRRKKNERNKKSRWK